MDAGWVCCRITFDKMVYVGNTLIGKIIGEHPDAYFMEGCIGASIGKTIKIKK